MSESTTEEFDWLDSKGIAEIRNLIHQGLLQFPADTQHTAFTKLVTDDSPLALVTASVILEHVTEFDNSVIWEAGQLLQQHGYSTAPDTELPAEAYQDMIRSNRAYAAAKRAEEEAADRAAAERAIAGLNDHDQRTDGFEMLRTCGDDTLRHIMNDWRRDPDVAVGTASIMLEHADSFNPELVAAATALLAQFGQSLEPGAMIMATPQLMDAVVESKKAPQIRFAFYYVVTEDPRPADPTTT